MLKETSLEKPFAIIAEEDVACGFKVLGFKTYAVGQPQECRVILEEIVKEGYAICLVQDNVYQSLEEEISVYKHLALPVFIPFVKNLKTDLLDNLVRDIRLRATGTF